MYFQVCSNSTYSQHSGERYRTSGPLVYLIEVIIMSKRSSFLSMRSNRNARKD